jgi:hypothetical protein
MTRPSRITSFALFLFAASVLCAAEYRGNTQSHVFHQESCRYYTCKNCTARFANADEAIEGGYRPCGTCRPPRSDGPSAARQSEESYSGNTSSRKFHRSSCRFASCKNCTAKFSTRDEAVSAGYSPGGCCKP